MNVYPESTPSSPTSTTSTATTTSSSISNKFSALSISSKSKPQVSLKQRVSSSKKKFSLSQRKKADTAKLSASPSEQSSQRPISLTASKATQPPKEKTTIKRPASTTALRSNPARVSAASLFSKKKLPLITDDSQPSNTPTLTITTDMVSEPSSSCESSPQASSKATTPTIRSSSTTSLSSDQAIDDNHLDITAFLAAPRLTQRVRLSSGRVVSFSEVGDRTGFPVFVFLGMGCVRYFIAFFDDLATSYGLRLICPDRPGIGLSDDVKSDDQEVLKWPGNKF
ncbi:10505_t:CDS:1 [Racocetra fulgida]|uniref:10505_t:CDS:1 n=1 Tax=Racocetra fulgida TaxID=60492 RepID=A0A9N9HYA8_9GLOM|nr:10505_t:CDS:1 [Racocetra fulgida]